MDTADDGETTSATRPRRASRSERRATRCPRSSCSPGLHATSPASASSAQLATEHTSFLGTCGHGGVAGWGAGEQGGGLRSREGGWVGGCVLPRAHLHGWGVGGTTRIRGSVHCHHAAAPAQPSDPGPNSVWKEGGQGPASLGGVGWVPPGLGASHTWGHCWDGGARPHTRGTMLRLGGTALYDAGTEAYQEGSPPRG